MYVNRDFCILIPTINQKELLLEALEYYKIAFISTSIYIVDNGMQNIPKLSPNIYIYPQMDNLGVSGSWNYLIEKAIHNGYNRFLILNDDIILKKDEKSIMDIIDVHGNNTFIRPEQFYNWSAFILTKNIYLRIGMFDTNFKKCYFEDNDYEYRMKLENIPIQYDKGLNAEVYNNSMTIKKEPSLDNFLNNRIYYQEKWGGLPTEEKYKTPFNLNA
jgi:GT2 family glycosyltransferase